MNADHDLVGANRDLWDGWTELHVPSEFYDVEGFKAGRDTLDEVELKGVLEAVGDVKGKSLLHLQCHFGLDTLSWARHGARVTGVDFSEKAVAHARRLAQELDIDARFVCADVTDTAAVLGELQGGQFDVVFTSHGTITWLPDLHPWARTVAGALKPGGIFFIADSHPFTWMFDEEATGPELVFRYDYFGQEALRFEEKGSYAVPDSDFRGVSYSWQHSFEEIVTSLAEAGLTILSIREYPHLAWRWFPWMVESEDGTYRLPEDMPQIPLMFSLRATRPSADRDRPGASPSRPATSPGC
ncbi:MAG: methyltransferase domain-containing protein [Thermoleophilia bacterium]|nr:methyltransferase domain-containing protein [Thermoleophilia bacterium]